MWGKHQDTVNAASLQLMQLDLHANFVSPAMLRCLERQSRSDPSSLLRPPIRFTGGNIHKFGPVSRDEQWSEK